MAKLAKAESKYSWWWDSHISPKNSKWLHENLTDMDTKVKQMIKLTEVDEDSFARRAEMYYKKRPELMKLVEEFYRAFRALAERYDHATGVIKQAHNTMPQAFSNQNPFIELDDESFTSPDDGSSHSEPANAESVSVEEKSFPGVKKEVNFHDVCEKELQIQMEEELDQDLSSQFEICILHSVLYDMKETNSSLLEKLFKTSKLSEELILELEYENIEQHEVVKFLSEQLRRLRMGMFQLSKVLDVDHELTCEDIIERDQIILHHILTKLDDTRGSFSKAWDENQELLIEKSVLETSLGQLKHELSDLKSVITGLQQEYRIGNDRLLSSQEDMRKLIQSHEQLILRIDEGSHREKSLVAEMVNLRKELLEMQDACQLKTPARLNDENNKLEHDNSCLIVDGDTLLLIFKTIGLERTEMINQLARNSGKLCDELKEIQTENSQLRLELARKNGDLSKKEMEFSEAVTLKVDQTKQIIELTERYDKQLKESESLHKSTQSELKKVRVEAEMWETIVGTSFVELQTSSVREALFEEKLCELSREYECLEDENHSKELEILKLTERIESLEGENNQINTQLEEHVQALATLKDSIASLESHTGLGNEKDSACSQEPSKNDISSFFDIAVRIKAVETKVVEAKKLSRSPRSKGSRLRHGSVGLSRSSESSESKSSGRHHHHRQQIMMKDIKLDQASKVSSRRKNTESDDRILELWETMDQAGSIDLTVGRAQKEHDNLRETNSKRKIVDKIASDVMKLTNLQITVQDLQQKVANPTKGEGLEHVKVKEQLDEAERAIAKLIGVNCRLMKNAGSSEKVMERARRCQEKIGRLEMDVKRIEFMVVKLDGESGSVAGRKTEIVLKDYLYGNSRTPRRRRKGRLCGCILPPASRD